MTSSDPMSGARAMDLGKLLVEQSNVCRAIDLFEPTRSIRQTGAMRR